MFEPCPLALLYRPGPTPAAEPDWTRSWWHWLQTRRPHLNLTLWPVARVAHLVHAEVGGASRTERG